jgi:hypothetical protein
VVALVAGSEATLKRIYREPGDKIRLQPANSTLDPIIVPAADVAFRAAYWLCCGSTVKVLRVAEKADASASSRSARSQSSSGEPPW